MSDENRDVGDIVFCGSESALVAASLFALVNWSFQVPMARAVAQREDADVARKLYERASLEWRQALDAAHLWDVGGPWTPELIAKRRALSRGLSLKRGDARTAASAVRAVLAEFSSDWDEFCTIAPGGLEWYGFTMDEVVALAERLERIC